MEKTTAPVTPEDITRLEKYFREWAKIWHGDCKQKSCDIAKAIKTKQPINILYKAVLDTDDDFQESWESYKKYWLLH